MSDDTHERIAQVLLFAGTNWSGQTPDEIIKALDMAGYVIVPRKLVMLAKGLLATAGAIADVETAAKFDDYVFTDAQMGRKINSQAGE